MKSKFLIVQLCLYIVFLILDITTHYVRLSSTLKLLSIGLCLIWLILNFVSVNKSGMSKNLIRSYKWMAIIMIFTFTSDIFLLFTTKYIVGIATFILVQLFYDLRLRNIKLKNALGLVFICSVFLVMGILISFKSGSSFAENFMLVEVIVYVLIFVSNLFLYGKRSKESVQYRWMFIGLCLYAICDLQVMIYNMPSSFAVPSLLTEISAVGMWLFYLPGQVILTLSADKVDP